MITSNALGEFNWKNMILNTTGGLTPIESVFYPRSWVTGGIRTGGSVRDGTEAGVRRPK